MTFFILNQLNEKRLKIMEKPNTKKIHQLLKKYQEQTVFTYKELQEYYELRKFAVLNDIYSVKKIQ